MQTTWLKDRRHNLQVVIVLVFAILMSCEEYKEGCMDASATNFKVSNQVPCCCEYPNLVFQTTLTDGENTLAFTDTFTNEIGQRFLINDLRFIASGITLTDSLDRVYKPTDTFRNYLVSPGILAANVLDLNSKGANFLSDGKYNRLDFTLDQVDELQSKVPEDFPKGHPLRDSMFYDFSRQSWVLARTVLEVVDDGLVTMRLLPEDLPQSVHVSGSWTKNRGKDLIVNFRVNIDALFGGMDFSLPETDLYEEFKVNFSTSFEP